MQMKLFALTALTVGLACSPIQVSAAEKGPSVQALLGAVKYDGLQIENSAGGQMETVDVSTMPQLGGAWSTAPKGDRIQFGLECTFLLGFNFESVNYSTSPTTRVSLDYDVWTFDLAGGAYANLFMGQGDRVRIYAAAGPLIMPTLVYSESYVDHSVGNDTYVRSNESAFGYGLYARTGVELRIQEYGMLGLGVRGNWLETDLGNADTMAGISAFVTYTAGL